MIKFFSLRKVIFILLAALVVALAILVYKAMPVQTREKLTPLGRGSTLREIIKTVPSVLVTKDDDGYGLQILARNFEGVKKVEMLVGYYYRSKENPSMVARGAPQQNSYWAHFRFESCSRGDCVKYKVNEANFQLTLNYTDGQSKDYTSTINIPEVSKNTLISLTPSI